MKSADSRNPPRSLNTEIIFLLTQGLNAKGIVERVERSLATLQEEVAKAEARGKALLGEITKATDEMDAAREKVEQAVAEAQAIAEAEEKDTK